MNAGDIQKRKKAVAFKMLTRVLWFWVLFVPL